jgi:hypothetical protein
MKGLIALIVIALVLGSLIPASITGAVDDNTVLNFDDLHGGDADTFLPTGYAGLGWDSTWFYWDWAQSPYTPHSLYTRIATHNYGGWIDFSPLGCYVTFVGAWCSGRYDAEIFFEGYRDGNLIGTSAKLTLSAVPTFLDANFGELVDKVMVVCNTYNYFAIDDLTYRLSDTIPPTVDNFFADKTSIVLGDTIRFSYSVSDTGGSGLKQVELWEATDTDGDDQPNWPSGQTDYVSMQTLSGDSAVGYFDYKPQELRTHWYGIHVVNNNGNWNDERNSRTDGLPGVFGPLQINIVGIIVNQPNGGETWDAGASQLISWISSGVTGNVDIKLSRDGGNKWENIVLNSANDGNEVWKATNPTTAQAVIKIVSKSDPNIYDFSDSAFSIVPATQGALAIRDFWPKSGYSGTKVTIIGDNFIKGKTVVRFGTIGVDEDYIRWISNTQMEVRVPNAPEGAITGKISVTTSEGIASSSEDFIVMPPTKPWATEIGVYNSVVAYSNGGWWSVHYDEVGDITRNGYGYAYQCVEYVNRYYMVQFSRNMIGTGNADSYFWNAASKGLVSYKNGGATAPKVNDILVFDGDNRLGGSLGHVAIITDLESNESGQITALWIIQQNVMSGPGGQYVATARLTVNVAQKKNDVFTYNVNSLGSGTGLPVIGWSRIP